MPGGYRGECGDDVDPMLFLTPPDKERIETMNKPYDIKRSCWVKDETEGFIAGEIQSEQSDQVTMKMVTNQTVTVKKDDIQQMNPPKFYQVRDVEDMTFLNEAGVLDNLCQCYINMKIYTYSGLFCVTINPYKWLPIYGSRVAKMYKVKTGTEMPSHLFSISDNAYHDMLMGVLGGGAAVTAPAGQEKFFHLPSWYVTYLLPISTCSGESSAGKTENTKKVTQYFAEIRGTGKQSSDRKRSLEDQIIQANPVLEAFGNAKTIRNNNSSRFGPWLQHGCKIAAVPRALVDSEASAAVRWELGQQQRESLLLVLSPKEYHWVNQSVTMVDNMDDGDDDRLEWVDVAFDVLGFSTEEKISVYRLTGGITHFGNVKFKQKPRQEQTEGTPQRAAPEGTAFGSFCADGPKVKMLPSGGGASNVCV
ncbi:Myosin-16 [Camelus dromedarius]|uniref:Myosin-16 n=1 Tax=Camelus dromedarius TaxID=9838 RepID=A0A5N4CWF2_CAMDR|nr:Myosin-16 [Camelus dromedarius]